VKQGRAVAWSAAQINDPAGIWKRNSQKQIQSGLSPFGGKS
jgi:hypothetical protein